MIKNFFLSVLVIFLASCSPSSSGGGNINPPPPGGGLFAKGADVSWLTEMEAAGKLFYNSAGVQQECMQLLKSLGINSIRLRVWENPAGGWNNQADVIAKAVRAKNLGLRIMIDFHYSDTWADPGNQTKPAAWTAYNFDALKQAVYDHTFNVLIALKGQGVTPEWVQVGNETNDGLLWPEGKASVSMANYAALINKGYDAVKAVDNNIKVIVHLSNGHDNNLYRWNLDGLKNAGGKWDITGMSLYPDPTNWSTMNTQCLANVNDMIARHNRPVMITEVGMSWDQPTAAKSFLTDLIDKLRRVANGNGLGVFYWEPQAYGNWKGYTKGAFDNSGKPTVAMNAFN